MQVELSKEAYAAVKDSLGDFITEKDGKQVFEAKTESELSGQQSALKKERKRADDAEAKFKPFADLDPDEARDALDQVKGGKLKNDAEVQTALKAARKEGADLKLKELQPTIDGLNKDIAHHKLTAPVKDAALKAGVLPKMIPVVMASVGSRFKLGEADKVEVLDTDGNSTTITPDDFFAKTYKTEFPEFFAANGGSGSGATGSNGGALGKTITRTAFMALGPAEQATTAKSGVTVVDG